MRGWKELKAFMATAKGSPREVRAAAIRHLRSLNYSVSEVSNVLDCDRSLVRYWSDDGARAAKKARSGPSTRRRRSYAKLATALEELYA